MEHKLAVLRGHCDGLGTDYDAIEKTVTIGADPLGDTDAFLTEMAAYAALGISLVTLTPATEDPVAWVSEVCKRVLPKMR
jgi:hypothetical protein